MSSDGLRLVVPVGSIVSDDMIELPEGSDPRDIRVEPELLRVPQHFHSVSDVLACATKMNLDNCVVLSEGENGSLVLLDSGLTMAETNWLIDRLKALMWAPHQPTRTGKGAA